MTISTDRPNVIVVLTAPSGGGKTVITRALLESDPSLAYSLSTTSRPKRPDEIDGVSYNFVSREEFERLRAQGVFLESATVHGHLYGTRRDIIEKRLAEGRDIIMDIDVQGARSMKRATDRAITIFILPPSLETLEKRLRARASDREADVERRLADARAEIAQASRFDYLVVNDVLEGTIAQIRAIIQAERRRASRQRIVCEGEGELDGIYPKAQTG